MSDKKDLHGLHHKVCRCIPFALPFAFEAFFLAIWSCSAVSLFSSMLPIYDSALFANPGGNGAGEAWIRGEFDQSSDVQIVGSHNFQAAYAQLHGQRRIRDDKRGFSLKKHSFFITYIRGEPPNLHVEPLDLFSCALHLEVLIHNLS